MADRLYFGKFEEVIEPPNLIEVQSRSYDEFLQKEVTPSERTDTGWRTPRWRWLPAMAACMWSRPMWRRLTQGTAM